MNIDADDTTMVYLDPSFIDSKIDALKAATPATFMLIITDGTSGDTVWSESRQIQLLPLSYFAFMLDGVDMRPYSAAMVTPDSTYVRSVLTKAAEKTPWGAIGGYQEVPGYSHDEVTMYQMAAVWDTLQEHGFTYVNAPEAYTTSGAQYVKPPAVTYTDRSGNCVESVLLLASVLEATGMTVNFVYKPSHVYLGVDVWYDEPTVIALETTMLPYASFDLANGYASYSYEQDVDSPGFQLIDVRQARAYGIMPNPWMT